MNEKSCCSVCDAKKKCYVCERQTLTICADCRIDFATSIYVCESKLCRDKHDKQCPKTLRDLAVALNRALIYLTVSLADQAFNKNSEGLSMWNSAATCELIKQADEILGTKKPLTAKKNPEILKDGDML